MTNTDNTLPLEIDVAGVHGLIEQDEPMLLLDCREQPEYDTVHIHGSTLLPMSEIQDRAGELAEHQGARVVVYCHHGGRSLQVATWLRQQGFELAQSMSGGIDQWSLDIDPNLPRY